VEFGLSSGGSKSARDRLELFGAIIVALAMIHVKLILDPLLSVGIWPLAQNGEAWEYLLVAIPGAMSHINLNWQLVRGIDHAFLFPSPQTGIATSALDGPLYHWDPHHGLLFANGRTCKYPFTTSHHDTS
jgi:hypothetical protein